MLIPKKMNIYNLLKTLSEEQYYVNTFPNSDGSHEVHKKDCQHIPNFLSRKFLDSFSSCKEAVKKAKKDYPTANGCKICSIECHKSDH